MKHRKEKAPVSKLYLFLIVLFSAGTLFFGWKIAAYFIDARKSQDFWAELQRSVILLNAEAPAEEAPGDGTPQQEEQYREAIPADIDFDRLRAVNEDVAAWLYAPGTTINYIVTQAADNDYYLRRLPDGTYANGGTPFVDYRCAADFTDWNTVIYGHHMQNGTMFGALLKYSDQAFYEEHPVMYLYLPQKRCRLDLVAGYTVDAADALYSLPTTKEQRDELLARAERNSTFISTAVVGPEDRLVTLSTCSDSQRVDSERYVVIARLVELETED